MILFVFSKIVRRTHIYLALFLAPWMIGYALSTLAMNHRMPRPTNFTKEIDQPYANEFEAGTPPREIARQILADLDLEGAFGVQGPTPDGNIVINRQGMMSPRRITFTPRDKRIVVERRPFSLRPFLSGMHTRGGYDMDGAWDSVWAVFVDIVSVGLILWIASGIYMWWGLPSTRRWGWIALGAGAACFAVIIATL